MARQPLKALFTFLVCMVMLAVQWVPAHAHLAAPHSHDDAAHLHSATVHAHPPVADHDDALDVGTVEDHAQAVVDLDQAACPCSGSVDQVSPTHPLRRVADVCRPTARFRPVVGTPLPNRRPPHVGEPRAPPRHA